MQLLKLKAKNFKQWKDVELDLSGLRLVSIIGQYAEDKTRSNSAGKSTIGDLIKYALFEWILDKQLTPDDLINWGEKRFDIELEFLFEKNKYRIKRSKAIGQSSVEFDLFINDQKVGKNITERRKILKDVLGMGADVADATWFFLQKESNKLTSADPAERKEYLSTVLQSWKWQPVHDVAKQKLLSFEQSLSAANTQKIQLSQCIQQLDQVKSAIFKNKLDSENDDRQLSLLKKQFDDNKNKIIELKRNCSEVLNKIESNNIADYELRSKLNDIFSKIEDVRRKIKLRTDEILATSVSIADNKEKIESIRRIWLSFSYPEDFYKAARDIAAKSAANLAYAVSEEIAARKREQTFSSGVCPTCQQRIADGHNSITSIQSDIKRSFELTKTFTEEDNRAKSNEKLAYENHLEIEKLTRLNDNLKSKVDASTEIIEQLRVSEASLIAEDGNIRAKVIELSASQQNLMKQATEMNADNLSNQCAGIESEQKRLSFEIEGLENSKRSLLIQLGNLQANERSYQTHIDVLKDSLLKSEGVEKQVKNYKILSHMFSRDGLALIKIGMAVKLIELYANELLQSILSEYSLSIAVESTTSRGSLNFQINTQDGVKSYSVFSGGEKVIIDVCLRMALSRVLAEGVGKNYKTLFLDEVFSELDVRNREKMLALLKNLSKTFSTIFVISHDREMQLAFPQILMVEKTGNVSSVRLLENSYVN